MKWILYVLAILIFYDLFLHLYELLQIFNITKKRNPFSVARLFDYVSKGDTQKRRKVYQIFWTAYWGIAFALFLAYFSLTR